MDMLVEFYKELLGRRDSTESSLKRMEISRERDIYQASLAELNVIIHAMENKIDNELTCYLNDLGEGLQ